MFKIGDKFIVEIEQVIDNNFYKVKGISGFITINELAKLEQAKEFSDPMPADFMIMNFINTNLEKGDEILIRDDESIDVVNDNIYRAFILMEDPKPKKGFTVNIYDYAANTILEHVNLVKLLEYAFLQGKVVSRVRSSVDDHGFVRFDSYNWRFDSEAENSNVCRIHVI